MLRALILFVPTSLTGLVLFYGSVHSGGTPFFIGMFFMPPLYLDYIGMVLLDNFVLDIFLGLSLQYILCLLLVYVANKLQNDNRVRSLIYDQAIFQ